MRKGLIVLAVVLVVLTVGAVFFYQRHSYVRSCIEGIRVEVAGFPTLLPTMEGEIPLIVTNPCDFGIYVEKLVYRVYVADRLVLEGEKEDVYIAPQGDTELRLPFKTKLGGLLETLARVFQGSIPWKLEILARVPIHIFGFKVGETLVTLEKRGVTKVELPSPKKSIEEIGKKASETISETVEETLGQTQVSTEYKVVWMDPFGNNISSARPGDVVRVCIYGGKPVYTIVRIKMDLALRPDKVVNETVLPIGIPPKGMCIDIKIEKAWGLRGYFVEIYLPNENMKYRLEPELKVSG